MWYIALRAFDAFNNLRRENMTEFQALRGLTIAITIGFIAIAAMIAMATVGFAVGCVIFSILLAVFLLQGFRNIPANPMMRGIPLFWGNYIDADNGGTSLGSGWWFFPFVGLLFDYILFDASQINLAMSVQERTPDRGVVLVDPYFTYIVDQNHPVWFIRAGDRAMVEKKFIERIDGRVREWISSQTEGPLTWPEALQSNGLAMDVIIRMLFPGTLPDIPRSIIEAITDGDEIPISMLIKYFTGRPPLPEKAPGVDDHDILKQEYRVKQTLNDLRKSNRVIWNQLEAAIRARIAITNDIKSGMFPPRPGEPEGYPINNLGIIVKLASLGNIKPEGATAAAADEVAKARQIALVHTIESDNFTEQVEKFARLHGGDMKAATEAIQLLRKLTTKSTTEQQFALRADNVQALLTILGPMGSAFAEWIVPHGKKPAN